MVRLGSKVGMMAAVLLAPLVAAAQTPPAAPSAEMTRQQIQEMRQAAQAARGGPEGAREARGGRGDFQGGNTGRGGFQGGNIGRGGFQVGGQRGGGFAAAAGAPVEAAQPVAPIVTAVVPAPEASTSVAGGRTFSTDPLAGLGGKVTAVLAISTAPRLLINENDHGVIDTRDLAVGDEYRDGWRLAAVNTTSVTMRKGEEQRQVALNINTGVGRAAVPGAPGAISGEAGASPATTPAPGRGALSLSNGNQAAGGRGGAQTAQGLDGAALATLFGQRIDPAQAQALAGRFQAEMQRGLASLPPEISNDPRAAAAITALQSGNLGEVLTQFQGALGGISAQAGRGPAGAPVFLFGGRGQ